MICMFIVCLSDLLRECQLQEARAGRPERKNSQTAGYWKMVLDGEVLRAGLASLLAAMNVGISELVTQRSTFIINLT